MTELSDAQRKLLEARLGKTPATGAADTSARSGPRTQPIAPRAEVEVIPPHGHAGPLPLSAGQQALLFEYHRRSDEPVYNVTHAYRIDGRFDLQRFGDAVKAAAAAHEPLHTSFGPDRRVLTADESVSLEYTENTQNLTAGTDPTAAFDELASSIATERIDLENGPLLRVVTCPLGPECFGIIMALHHVSCDAGSLAVLWDDIATVYAGGELPNRDVTYADHSQWQRSKVSDDDIDWWLEQLGPSPQPVSLAFQRVPDEPDGYLIRQLRASAADIDAFGTRPLPVFLGAFGALLQHLGRVDEPAVAVALSTRDHPATESMVGYFLSMLPFTVPVGKLSFRSLVSEVEGRLAGGMLRRHVPLGDIVRRVRSQSSAVVDIDALSRTMFVFDAAHTPELPGVTIDEKIYPNGSSVAGLTLFVRPAGHGGWEAALEYRGEDCSAAQAAMILDLFDSAITTLLAEPDAEVRSLALDSADSDSDHAIDLHGGEITAAMVPLSELVADIAEAGPIAPAVRCGDVALTYGELCSRADLLARRLRSEGVGSGDRVAIMLGRSVDVVVAILGVLRAGAAYVPIDPDYPSGRVSLILDAANPSAVVTSGSSEIPALDVPTVFVPTRADGVMPADRSWRPVLDDPAYVIFTSGSTGTPRGVEVTHRNLSSSTLSRFDVYDDQPERFLLLSSYGFDSSIVGLFWTLAAGGEIVMPTDSQTGDFDQIAGLVSSAEVTHLLAVPTLYDALLRRAPDRLAGLRVAIVAGEAAPVGILGRHHAMVPRCRLINEYGPTEASVWATSFDCLDTEASAATDGSLFAGSSTTETVSIGTPIPGTFVRVADQHGRRLPHGVAGELSIGGMGVTSGYINDHEATKAKFFPDSSTGSPMFRTGDLVRVNASSQLDFLGRVDNQLSVGGVRIEPEEIESVLSTHPSVQASVVLVDSGRRLIALVEPDAATAAPASPEAFTAQLRSRIVGHLPEALVPNRIIVVDELPRTVHGKVDRAKAESKVPQVELTIAEDPGVVGNVLAVWRNVLGNNSLHATSDFFDSGGDSLRALELCERLEPLAGRRVGMGELIDARTPAKLAAALGLVPSPAALDLELFETLRQPATSSSSDPKPTLVLLPPGGGNLLAYRALVHQLDDQQPIVGFRLPGADGRSAPVHSILEQADRILPELLAAVPPADGYNLLGWSTGGLLAIELASRLDRLGHAVELLAMIDTIYPGHQRTEKATKLAKYRALLDDGGFQSVVGEVQERTKIRTRERSAWLRARVAERRGITDDAKANEQRLFEIAFGAAETYRPPTYDGSVTFFAASGTNASRTITPWSDHLATIDVVVVEGEHAEENAVLDSARVGPIVDHVAKLLAVEPQR